MEKMFIKSGYRKQSSFYDGCHTLFSLHNETCNVWTHFVPFLFSLCLLGDEVGRGNIILSCYCFSMAICFGTSTLYHLGTCAPDHTVTLLMKMDRIGILTLLWGSNVPMVYYGFQCSVELRGLYFGVGAFLVAAVCAVIFCTKNNIIPDWLPPLLFVLLVFYGWIQAIHEYMFHGPPSPRSDLVVEVYVKAFMFYVVGFFFYATKIPERWFPGKFDLVGNSHNLWHICCAMGAFAHYKNCQAYRRAAEVEKCNLT